MSEFIRSTQATNSPRSVGRLGSRMRWMWTPPERSWAGDSSPPRVSTCTSTPRSTSASESLRTWRARPPSISGGYSQERMRTRVKGGWGLGLGLQKWRETEIRRKRTHTRIGVASGLYCLQQGLAVVAGADEGVVAGLAAGVEEGPVAGLGGQQLAGGAGRGPAAQ